MTAGRVLRTAILALAVLAGMLLAAPVSKAADNMPLAVAGRATVGNHPDAVAVDPATHRVYLASSRDRRVLVLDGATLRLLATLERNPALAPLDDPIFRGDAALVAALYPNSVAVDAASGDVYVVTGVGFISHTLERLDGRTRRVLAARSLGYDGATLGMTVDAAAHMLYMLTNERSNGDAVVRLDGTTLQPAEELAGYVPSSLAFNVVADAVTHHVFVAGGALFVYDGATAQSISQPPTRLHLPVSPDHVALDPAARAVYAVEQVVSVGYGQVVLSAFDAGTGTPLGAAAVEARPGQDSINPGALTLAVDPVWHRVYVADQDTGVVTAVDGRGYTATGPAMPRAGGGGGRALPHR